MGASATAGRYDKDAQLGYLAWGADASVMLGRVTLRGEYATRETDLDPNAKYPYALIDPWLGKEGWYGELEFPVPVVDRWVSAALRYDELRRRGTPLSASSPLSSDSTIARYTAGLIDHPRAIALPQGRLRALELDRLPHLPRRSPRIRRIVLMKPLALAVALVALAGIALAAEPEKAPPDPARQRP